ncbi:hypothetical protein [Idiomarina ramblicola]|uniref:Uncharacterized protein n=1 Tax=Idiomarina ramblicola TaxID=263724 RepID=A0A432Z5T1_9GAMM|nr:hypothetical protein [Idiomarina ramblicola]RUO73251.1 hypothetical protein CWI78_02050 [Idiomarina ramblicola]
MASSLDDQIAQMEQNLKNRKLALKVRSRQVVSTTCDKLSSPTALCFAVGAGFFVGKLSDRPKKEAPQKQGKSKSGAVLKVLRIITSAQTAASFAKHL